MGFEKWVLQRGMLFNSPEKWWPSEGTRPTGHEGLDICLFLDDNNNLHELVAPIQVPAAMDGRIVKIMQDFLDLSIVVYHEKFSDAEWGFYTIYAHTTPEDHIIEGKNIEEGNLIATIQKTKTNKKLEMLPHLHISLGWIHKSLPLQELSWPAINKRKYMYLLDPLPLLQEEYIIQKNVSGS
ncbi:MAG: peptidoglycan DD-metalloendopeptidase family protein [Desulfohalobiaceae bacterium]